MKTVHFWQLSLLIFMLLCKSFPTHAQSSALGLGLQWAKPIANHPKYPDLAASVGAIELRYQFNTESQHWQSLYPKARFSLLFNYQQTGNPEILGHAWALAPMLGLGLLEKKAWRMEMQLAWGLAYASRRFDSFSNPQNIVLGSRINAFASARLQAAYQLKRWHLRTALIVSHYSNGNYSSPNLGINLAAIELGLDYRWQSTKENKEPKNRIPKQGKFSPFIQASLGATSRFSRGPIFPVYVLSTGLHWQYSPRALAGAGLEFSRNTAISAFRFHNSPQAYQSKDFNRYCFWLHHEFLLGHIGFQTLGGLYLNKHVDQGSVFATGMGINFYLKNPYFYKRHQTWVGIHVRAYMGLAEFVMLQAGYKW